MVDNTLNSSRKKRPIARALHAFIGQNEHELTFSPGEAILLLKRVDDNWLEGELGGRIGIFPSNRVRIEVGSPSLSQESDLARSGKARAVVLHDFPGNVDGDLPLMEGQLVELLGTVTSGWMKGRIEGRTGIFPASFVEVVQPLAVSRQKPVPRSKPVPKPRSRVSNNQLSTANGNKSDKLKDSEKSEQNGCNGGVYQNISSLTRDIAELSTTLQAEEKMMESNLALLEVCKNDEKQVKLASAIEDHKASIESYKRKIDEMEVEREDLMSQNALSPPATPPSPATTTKAGEDGAVKRMRVVQELYETEKEYHKELQTLTDKVLPSFKKWKGVKYEAIFCNIEQVAILSGDLADQLKAIMDSYKETSSDDSIGVGAIFKDYADRIGAVYGVYCRGQDSAAQLLEKLYEDESKAAVIREYFNLGRPEITSWDLHTLLIKPVQRIVKYPLLLDNLLKATPTDSSGYTTLRTALNTSAQIAQDMNEIRRRKDILDRYTGSGRDEKRVNFGTLRKKVRRFNQSIVQRTGFRSATIDSNYDQEESRVFALENCLRNFQQNVLSWHEEGERLLECRDILSSAISLYMGDDDPVAIEAVEMLYNIRGIWNESSKTLFNDVIGQISALLDLFRDPLLLMNKRGDKLLDYDSLQHNLEKTTEHDKIESLREQVTLAKRTYEALNTQLLEDLPVFIDRVCEAISLILTSFIRYQYELNNDLASLMSSNSVHSNCQSITDFQSIISSSNALLRDTSNELNRLTIVPSTLCVSLGPPQSSTAAPSRSSSAGLVKSVSVTSSSPPIMKKSLSDIPRSRRLSMPVKRAEPIYEEISTPPTSNKLKANKQQSLPSSNEGVSSSVSNYDTVPDEPVGVAESLDNLLIKPTVNRSKPVKVVAYDFTAENEGEISVAKGDRVRILSANDGDGDSDWCLVELDSNHHRGYIPTNYLS